MQCTPWNRITCHGVSDLECSKGELQKRCPKRGVQKGTGLEVVISTVKHSVTWYTPNRGSTMERKVKRSAVGAQKRSRRGSRTSRGGSHPLEGSKRDPVWVPVWGGHQHLVTWHDIP